MLPSFYQQKQGKKWSRDAKKRKEKEKIQGRGMGKISVAGKHGEN